MANRSKDTESIPTTIHSYLRGSGDRAIDADERIQVPSALHAYRDIITCVTNCKRGACQEESMSEVTGRHG